MNVSDLFGEIYGKALSCLILTFMAEKA